jgi:hypothetical protein
MLRTLWRTVVVLLLVAVVASALYLLVAGHASSLSDEPREPSGTASLDHRDGDRRGGPREGRRHGDGGHPGREDASVGHGIAGMAGTAVQLGVVGAVVVGLQKRSRSRRRQRPRQAEPGRSSNAARE